MHPMVYFIRRQVIKMIIREMRTELGDTQSEFATRYNIPFRTIQNWETGVRKPPEYIIELLGQRVRADLANRRTVSLPKYDPKKQNLPKRRDFLGSVAWLKAVQACLGEEIVFALDEALMCQGIFGGRSDEYIVWVYGDDVVTDYNGVVVLGNWVSHYDVESKNGLLYTDFSRTISAGRTTNCFLLLITLFPCLSVTRTLLSILRTRK
jgi:transcriptional regulator with XRE-family HTH domain